MPDEHGVEHGVEREVKQFNVYLPVDLIRAVKHHAVETEQSLSAIVEAALEDHLDTKTRRQRRGD
jgi:predicted HicB family RNase H-like nuclease